MSRDNFTRRFLPRLASTWNGRVERRAGDELQRMRSIDKFTRPPPAPLAKGGARQKERILKRLFSCGCLPVRALSSSIGKKIVMAITGLALCGFLVAHLGGNLLLYVGEESYNHYAHTLHAQKILLPIAEIGLLVLFVGHIWLALKTKFENDD